MGVFWQRKGVSIIYPQQLEGAKRIVCEKQLEGSGLAPPDRIMAVRHKEECRIVSRIWVPSLRIRGLRAIRSTQLVR